MDSLLTLAAEPSAWVALVTLIAMEVVLGIDNLIFIAILTNKLPEEQRAIALWEAKGATLLADDARRRGTSEPENDPRPLPQGDHREVGPPPAPRLAKEGEPSRRVQPNAATAMLVRLHAHLAARDFDAVAKDSREDMESIDHPSGSSYGREAIVASLRRFFR
jgi:hypothetical protein